MFLSSIASTTPNTFENQDVNKERTPACCFNKTTYYLLKEKINQKIFHENLEFYLRTIHVTIVSYDKIDLIHFHYYILQNTIRYADITKILQEWDISNILAKNWNSHHLFIQNGLPENYLYQKMFILIC